MRLSRGDVAIAVLLGVVGLGFVISRATLRESARAQDALAASGGPVAASTKEAEASGDSAARPPTAEIPAGETPAAATAPDSAAGDTGAADTAPAGTAPAGGDTGRAGDSADQQAAAGERPDAIDIYQEQVVPAEFGTGEASPRSFASDELDRLGRGIRDCPGTILVTGHTDASGARGENQRISLDRARFVQAMLIQQGVPADRITLEGLGGEVPIANNRTTEGRIRNRRVTVVCTR